MSRYDLTIRPDVDATSATVGWDRPLQTFFVQVRRLEDGEEISFIWEGTDYRELPRPADAIRIVEPFCEIPEDLGKRLEIDRMKTSGQADGDAQIAAKAFIRGRKCG